MADEAARCPIDFLPVGWHPTWPPAHADVVRVEPGFDDAGNIVEISLVDKPGQATNREVSNGN